MCSGQGKSYGLADKLSKMIPFEVGMTLEKAVEEEESLQEFLKQDDEASEIWSMALQLEVYLVTAASTLVVWL